MATALILDDSVKDAALAVSVLEKNNYSAASTASIDLARSLVLALFFDVVVVDINIEAQSGVKGTDRGVAFARRVRALHPRCHVILWGASSNHYDEAKAAGASYVTKRAVVESRLGEIIREWKFQV